MTDFRLPRIYEPASVHNVTRYFVADDKIGLSFRLVDGTLMRVALSADYARQLAECLREQVTEPFATPKDRSGS